MIIDAQKKHIRIAPPIIAGDFRYANLIQRCRNGAHIILCQHQLQKPSKLAPLQGKFAQNQHKLIQHIAQNTPNLGIFIGQFVFPHGAKARCFLLQLLRQPDRLQKSI